MAGGVRWEGRALAEVETKGRSGAKERRTKEPRKDSKGLTKDMEDLAKDPAKEPTKNSTKDPEKDPEKNLKRLT